VRELNKQGMTIILTTHYLEEAEEMCDEIAIINHGEVVVRDRTQSLLARIDRKTILITPDAALNADSVLPQGPGMAAHLRPDGRLAISYNRSETQAGAVLEAVRAAGIGLRDLHTEEADLEDVFLDLTRSR
jgi:ABC-2 type transport system ATP-binding protein